MAPIPPKSRKLSPAIRQVAKKQIHQRSLKPRPPITKPSSGTPVELPHYTGEENFAKIAIIQPASWGDNINSTLMLKPIKDHYGHVKIDVFTADSYASAFVNNPLIDQLITFPAPSKDQALHLLRVIPPLINDRGYTKVFCPHPMINGDKWTSIKHGEFGTNLINAWVRALEEAGIEFTIPLETILKLTDQEIHNVDAYCSKINMSGRNVLMEVEGLSGQTFWDAEWTTRVGHYLLRGDTNLFISRRGNADDIHDLECHAPGHVHFVGGLTIRECAELYNRCDAFFSVSSGLSNACNTNWCKKDKIWVETINSDAVSSAPIRREGKIFWMQHNLDGYLNMLRDRGI